MRAGRLYVAYVGGLCVTIIMLEKNENETFCYKSIEKNFSNRILDIPKCIEIVLGL